jgi:hypothetical protein
LLDPAGKAREILKKSSSEDGNIEANFLENIIEKVEKNVDPNANPMEAISSIMQSGVFQELVSGMGDGVQNGNLDIGKLLSTVQKMVGGLDGGSEGEGLDSTMNLMSTMMANLNTGAGDSNQPGAAPDISNIMSMMGPMFENMKNSNSLPQLEN